MEFTDVSQPKLSIITICRNEKYIEETCRSVAEQVYSDFEWLVIDGASTDGTTLEVLERYREHMAFFLSEPDTGRYNAMNKGIAHARGEYVLFLNGGDALHNPLVLERLFNYPTANPTMHALKPRLEADLIYGEVVSRETGFMPWPLWSLGPQSLDGVFFYRYNLPHQATFIKRSLFDKYGCYDESYRSAGDYDWFTRVVLVHRATTEYIPLVVSIYNFEGISSYNVLSMDPVALIEGKRVHEAYAKYFSKYAVNREWVWKRAIRKLKKWFSWLKC